MNDEQNIDMTTLLQEWETAKTHRESYTTDFPSLDSLVSAVPLQQQKGAPFVGDTTLAGLVRSIPRASLQQIPIFSGVVNGSKNSVEAHIASWILRKGVFDENTFGKGILSTMQMGAEKALTHGYAPFMTATGTMYDEFGTTMKLLHYTDVDPEPGIQDANEAGFFYVTANLTKSRVKKILRAAMSNPNTVWDVEALKELLQRDPESKSYSMYQTAPEQANQGQRTSSTYEFITRYEVGKSGKFITFCPQLDERPLRVIPNKSKFGYPRVQFLVLDPAPLTPFGLSRVRLASPNQNLNNVYYQNIASMLLLNSKPPVLKRGRFTKPIQLKQGAIWEALDQNAMAELKSMDNGALSQFKPISEHMSKQIQNIMGNSIDTINSGSSFSKTGPGVRQADKVMDMSTNQITNVLENFLRQYALVALDTYVSEQSGTQDLLLDDEAKNAINRLQPNAVGDDNMISINWEEYYEGIKSWSVEIELSIGKKELEKERRADLQDTLTVLAQNAEAIGPEAMVKVREITDMLLEETVPASKRMAMEPSQPMGMPQEGMPPQGPMPPANIQ